MKVVLTRLRIFITIQVLNIPKERKVGIGMRKLKVVGMPLELGWVTVLHNNTWPTHTAQHLAFHKEQVRELVLLGEKK